MIHFADSFKFKKDIRLNFTFCICRDLALEVLKREPEGAFLVRESNSRSGRLALSVRVPLHFHSSGIAHYLIVRAPKGFRIKVIINYCCNKHNYNLRGSLQFYFSCSSCTNAAAEQPL